MLSHKYETHKNCTQLTLEFITRGPTRRWSETKKLIPTGEINLIFKRYEDLGRLHALNQVHTAA